MTDITQWGQIITAAAALVSAIVSLRNQAKINTVHVAINSRMDQLLESTGIQAKAAGVLEGKTTAETKAKDDEIAHSAGVAEGQAGKLSGLAVFFALATLGFHFLHP